MIDEDEEDDENEEEEDEDEEPAVPPEPWYYGFLVFYALACIVLGAGQFLVVLGIAATAESDRPGGSVVSSTFVFLSLGWMLGLTLVASPILLAVDAARNIRAIRYERGRPTAA